MSISIKQATISIYLPIKINDGPHLALALLKYPTEVDQYFKITYFTKL